MKKIQIISFTAAGFALSEKMRQALKTEYEICLNTTKESVYRNAVLADIGREKLIFGGAQTGDHAQSRAVHLVSGGLKTWCRSVFLQSDALIFIGASGIAVRTVAPFLVSKTEDPAVLAADECGRYIISLLSGHLGGGNALAQTLAEKIGAEAVITTASDVNGKLAVDVWAQKNHLVITDMKKAKKTAAAIVAGQQIPFYCEGNVKGAVPEELRRIKTPEEGKSDCGIAVSVYEIRSEHMLHLIPKAVILGVGCRRDKPFSEIRDSVFAVLEQHRISPKSIAKMASIDLKADEPGLLELAQTLQIPFETFPAETLKQVSGKYEASQFVKGITGVDNVCERAAMASLEYKEQLKAKFICKKTAANGVTAALLCREWSVSFE